MRQHILLRWPAFNSSAAVALSLTGLLLGIGTALAPVLVIALCIAAIIQMLVYWRVESAAYLYIGLFPLTVGIDRGAIFALLRPNEVILVLLWICVIVSALIRRRSLLPVGGIKVPDVLLVILATTTSLYSLLTMWARGLPIASDDYVYAMSLWKLLAVYLLLRTTLRSVRSIRQSIQVLVYSTSIVVTIGLLQVSGINSIVSALSAVWSDADEYSDGASSLRASSTLGAPIPFADFMAISSVLLFGLASIARIRHHRRLLRILAILCALGCFASGQASGVLALIICFAAFGLARGRPIQYLSIVAGISLASVLLLRSVVGARVDQIDQRTGLPAAWTGTNGRLANLQNLVLPELTSGWNWLLGVRTSARIVAPEPWREWIYIESGYAWLVWVGGVPALIAFIAFLVSAALAAYRVRAYSEDLSAIIGATGIAIVSLLAILMVLDPHLTYRGSSDLIVSVLSLCVGGQSLFSRGGADSIFGANRRAHQE